MTRGQDGSLRLSCVTLSSTTPRRFYPGARHGLLDGFCIGQSIADPRFDAVNWIIPRDVTKEACVRIACRPTVAFRGYPESNQQALAEAVSWIYGWIDHYNILLKSNLEALRLYKYECNASARTHSDDGGGPGGERRFLGLYRSTPSGYLTMVGLRLIDSELRVYRIVREYPHHTKADLITLGKKLSEQYGDALLLYGGDSSNAYSEVAKQTKNGWFALSDFNWTDPSDNTGELVLIDPRARSFLEPASKLEGGEIKPLPVKVAGQCSQSVPLQ
jgi:hypothetical protein